jgi:hypothetical protein
VLETYGFQLTHLHIELHLCTIDVRVTVQAVCLRTPVLDAIQKLLQAAADWQRLSGRWVLLPCLGGSVHLIHLDACQ